MCWLSISYNFSSSFYPSVTIQLTKKFSHITMALKSPLSPLSHHYCFQSLVSYKSSFPLLASQQGPLRSVLKISRSVGTHVNPTGANNSHPICEYKFNLPNSLVRCASGNIMGWDRLRGLVSPPL